MATNLDDAIALENKIAKLSTVADIEPPPDVLQNFIESNQVEKLPLIDAIKRTVAPLNFSLPDTRPVDLNDLSARLYSLYGYCGAALEAIGTNDPALSEPVESVASGQSKIFAKTMLAGDDAESGRARRQTTEFQQAFFNDIRDTFNSFKSQNISFSPDA